MINRIEITNFKGIRDTVSIELKPITLLFGPNSAGKSTIIQALHYAAEILRGNYDPVSSQWGNSGINLGGGYNIVHNHNVENTISLGFELFNNSEFLPGIESDPVYFLSDDLSEEKNREQLYNRKEEFNEEFESAKIKIDIAKNKVTGAVRPVKYELTVNNLLFATLQIEDTNPKNTFVYFSFINIDHPILKDEVGDIPRGYFFEALTNTEIKSFQIRTEFTQSVVPLDFKLAIHPDHFNREAFSLSDPMETKEIVDFYDSMLKLVCWGVTSITDLLREDLKELIYIGPIRELPPRNFIPKLPVEQHRWHNGMAAWDYLYKSKELIEDANLWLSRLEISYKLQLINMAEIDEKVIAKVINQSMNSNESINEILELFDIYSESPELAKINLVKKLHDIFSKYQFDLSSTVFNNQSHKELFLLNDNDVKLQPNDLGIGISQVIPVIIAALLKNNLQNLLIAIEQPELHIHPALQVKLADLFIKQRGFSKYIIRRKYFLIETHSEHLMLRFLRRIGETTKGKTKEFAITKEDINVYWCEPQKDGLKIELMPVDETGEFTRQWPRGFFEEREEELFPND